MVKLTTILAVGMFLVSSGNSLANPSSYQESQALEIASTLKECITPQNFIDPHYHAFDIKEYKTQITMPIKNWLKISPYTNYVANSFLEKGFSTEDSVILEFIYGDGNYQTIINPHSSNGNIDLEDNFEIRFKPKNKSGFEFGIPYIHKPGQRCKSHSDLLKLIMEHLSSQCSPPIS